MDSIQATRLRKGMLIKLDLDLFRVIDLHHLTPGNKRGFVQSRLRNIRTGALSEHKFRSEDDVERATLDEREMQFMYSDGETFHFMDTATFEQAHLGGDVLGDVVSYLLPNAVIRVELYEGEPVGIELPKTVDLTVEDTAPAIKRATASAPAQAGEAGDRAGGPGAALREHRRQDLRQHRNGRIPVAGVALGAGGRG